MNKKIKIIIYIIAQISILLALFLITLLTIKYHIQIGFSMMILSITQLFLVVFVASNFKKGR
ncbi:hypothetical protein CFB3_34820 [Clostridium folliculivorans]|uniref:Uncharacterized protein n=1 Tax=Clostridium folliculivorans TaxID=2886038 RepID=A0A9W5Y4W1_9CLOT|nr:hypothetical protein CFOLD11_36080 [Clostridium folliculivorans]GKU31375.1 hypothetical protein CFB3_34820 [Clostridium folliculivorans]